MVSGPVTVKVNLFGNVVGTNPNNLREKIKEKESNKVLRINADTRQI